MKKLYNLEINETIKKIIPPLSSEELRIWKIAEGLDIPLATLVDELTQKLGDDFSLSDIK